MESDMITTLEGLGFRASWASMQRETSEPLAMKISLGLGESARM